MYEVSVILCVLNGAEVIRGQLQALDLQVGAPDFEVIVVDNGSTDSTKRLVDEWITETCHAARSVSIVDAAATPGIPGARNAGALVAEGRVLAFCDADDQVEPGWVAAFAEGVDTDMLAGGRISAVDSKGQSRPDTFGEGLIGTRYLPHIGGANFAVTRAAFFAVGGFDRSLPRYGYDDVDFSWRVQEAGYPIRYVPDAVVRFTLASGGASFKKKYSLGRGRVLMSYRYPQYDPVSSTLRGIAARLGGAVRRTAVASLRTRSVDRTGVGQCVSALGALHGFVDYRLVKGFPARDVLGTGAKDG